MLQIAGGTGSCRRSIETRRNVVLDKIAPSLGRGKRLHEQLEEEAPKGVEDGKKFLREEG
jgi:hypothetical protein